MTNEAIRILKREAKKNKHKVLDCVFGELHLKRTKAIDQSSGSVYAILMHSDTAPNESLAPIIGYPKLYPVYWGKDIAPVSRLKAHVQNHKTTGNANLRNIKEIKGKKLIYGAIFVERYFEFETYLHNIYPPIKGSSRAGSKTKIINVLK